ncbi:MAG: hypothetical protein EXX96DRAFT_580835 [Benjaminiella poitrasii]|nr:MAG: hypothetical protein EXX96DRAFT_580835 [Benjaminiella poitrasii]
MSFYYNYKLSTSSQQEPLLVDDFLLFDEPLLLPNDSYYQYTMNTAMFPTIEQDQSLLGYHDPFNHFLFQNDMLCNQQEPSIIQQQQPTAIITTSPFTYSTLSSKPSPTTTTSTTSLLPRRQRPRHDNDLYTPKWVRYTGNAKQGYCDLCQKWFQLKTSAYWYHLQFSHGICSVTGTHFKMPLCTRKSSNGKVEGFCHQCRQFVTAYHGKKKNYMLWYRHAHKCHLYDKPR